MLWIFKQLRKMMTSVDNYVDFKKLKKCVVEMGFWIKLGFGGKEECISKIELAMSYWGEHLKKTYEDPQKVLHLYAMMFQFLCSHGGMYGVLGWGESVSKITLKPVY